jgi:hypothetical protein
MKLIKVAKNNKLEKVNRLMGEVCEELKKEGVSSDANSIRLDIQELIHTLKS